MEQIFTAETLAVLTHDQELLDRVLSVTAATGVDPLVLPQAAALRPLWASAAMVLVGADQAGAVSRLALARRSAVYVVAEDAAAAEATRAAAQIGAAAVLLPSHGGWLAGTIADLAGAGVRRGRLVAVVGGSGGVGASTLAAAVATVAARDGTSAVLVDTDVRGGGIDLLLGGESAPGWRWPQLATVRGHLGDLTSQLPCLDGLHLVSMGRSGPPGWEPGADELGAVLSSTVRSHDVVVVDAARSLSLDTWSALEAADRWVMLVAGNLRGVAAARETQRILALAGDRLSLVLRSGRHHVLPADVVADSLGAPVVGTIRDERSVALAAERGEPPGRAPRTPLARVCRLLLAGLAESAA